LAGLRARTRVSFTVEAMRCADVIAIAVAGDEFL
jgi:hypothetical protein